MKMNSIINPARILNRFGKDWLIKGPMGNMNWWAEALMIALTPRNGLHFLLTRLFSPGRLCESLPVLSTRREMIVVSAMG